MDFSSGSEIRGKVGFVGGHGMGGGARGRGTFAATHSTQFNLVSSIPSLDLHQSCLSSKSKGAGGSLNKTKWAQYN